MHATLQPPRLWQVTQRVSGRSDPSLLICKNSWKICSFWILDPARAVQPTCCGCSQGAWGLQASTQSGWQSCCNISLHKAPERQPGNSLVLRHLWKVKGELAASQPLQLWYEGLACCLVLKAVLHMRTWCSKKLGMQSFCGLGWSVMHRIHSRGV